MFSDYAKIQVTPSASEGYSVLPDGTATTSARYGVAEFVDNGSKAYAQAVFSDED